MIQQLIHIGLAFAIGGLTGAWEMRGSLISDVLNGTIRLPWKAKSIFWRSVSMKGFEEIAEEAEADFREAYGYVLVSVMRDLGGPSPLPQTQSAMEALLSEAERRFKRIEFECERDRKAGNIWS